MSFVIPKYSLGGNIESSQGRLLSVEALATMTATTIATTCSKCMIWRRDLNREFNLEILNNMSFSPLCAIGRREMVCRLRPTQWRTDCLLRLEIGQNKTSAAVGALFHHIWSDTSEIRPSVCRFNPRPSMIVSPVLTQFAVQCTIRKMAMGTRSTLFYLHQRSSNLSKNTL